MGGGCINQAYKLTTSDNKNFFCKTNSASKFPQLFQKEKNGLLLIERQQVLRTPAIVACGETEHEQFLLLEWIDEGNKTKKFWEKFGHQMAAMHSVKGPAFGLDENNFMGSVVQQNFPLSNWPSFFAQYRLRPLAESCLKQGLLLSCHMRQLERLSAQLHNFFPDEPPALVHGDLWSGNFMCASNEEPVLIDPAVYFGHPSVDMAMTTLFGSFDKRFYEVYHEQFPLPPNYSEQWKICNLYPLLVHLWLFGSSYRPQIEHTLKEFAS